MVRRPLCSLAFAAAAAAAAASACGDNTKVIDAPPIDRPRVPGMPDLALVGEAMAPTVRVVSAPAGACELEEGCVDGPGQRQLLVFDTHIANRGDGDLVVGRPPPAGESNDRFVWSPCHGHHHVTRFAEYELRDASGVVMAGHKQAFCLEDRYREKVSAEKKFTCDNQGISIDAVDVYESHMPCQWIDVTTATPGTYTLVVRINPTGELPDKDLTNNEWTYPGVQIGAVK